MATGSLRGGIRVKLDYDSKTDPDLLSKSVGVDSMESLSKTSNTSGGGASFVFVTKEAWAVAVVAVVRKVE